MSVQRENVYHLTASPETSPAASSSCCMMMFVNFTSRSASALNVDLLSSFSKSDVAMYL